MNVYIQFFVIVINIHIIARILIYVVPRQESWKKGVCALDRIKLIKKVDYRMFDWSVCIVCTFCERMKGECILKKREKLQIKLDLSGMLNEIWNCNIFWRIVLYLLYTDLKMTYNPLKKCHCHSCPTISGHSPQFN